jgi:hypothetical protein
MIEWHDIVAGSLITKHFSGIGREHSTPNDNIFGPSGGTKADVQLQSLMSHGYWPASLFNFSYLGIVIWTFLSHCSYLRRIVQILVLIAILFYLYFIDPPCKISWHNNNNNFEWKNEIGMKVTCTLPIIVGDHHLPRHVGVVHDFDIRTLTYAGV